MSQKRPRRSCERCGKTIAELRDTTLWGHRCPHGQDCVGLARIGPLCTKPCPTCAAWRGGPPVPDAPVLAAAPPQYAWLWGEPDERDAAAPGGEP